MAAQFDRIITTLDSQFPQVTAMLNSAREDLFGPQRVPPRTLAQDLVDHPLERLHREVKRRCDVVGVLPNDTAIDRLVTAVFVEQHDEWAVAERRYLSETSMARLRQANLERLPAPRRTRRRLAG